MGGKRAEGELRSKGLIAIKGVATLVMRYGVYDTASFEQLKGQQFFHQPFNVSALFSSLAQMS